MTSSWEPPGSCDVLERNSSPSASALAELLVAQASAGTRDDDRLAVVLRRAPPGPHLRAVPGQLSLQVEPLQASIRVCRDVLTEWLQTARVGPAAISDLKLIVSELVANAVEVAASAVMVWAWPEGADMVLEVADDGPGFPGEPRITAPEDDVAPGGRGLQVVDAISDEVVVRSGRGGTRVTVRLQGVVA